MRRSQAHIVRAASISTVYAPSPSAPAVRRRRLPAISLPPLPKTKASVPLRPPRSRPGQPFDALPQRRGISRALSVSMT